MNEGEGATGTEVAELLEITPRRVQQLAAEGIFPKLERGRYPLVACLRAYVRYWQERADGRLTENDLDRARLEKEQLEVRRRQIEVAKAEGELVTVDDHRAVVGKLADAFRAALLSVPGSWGPRVVGIPSPAEGTEAMRLCSEEMLRDMASVADALDLEGQPSTAEPLPEDFPGYRVLVAAGVETFDALRALEDVTQVRGIGPKLAERIEAEEPAA